MRLCRCDSISDSLVLSDSIEFIGAIQIKLSIYQSICMKVGWLISVPLVDSKAV